jgi:hypothetical protein
MKPFLKNFPAVLFLCLILLSTGLTAQVAEGVYATSLGPLKNAAYKFVFAVESEIPAEATINIVFPPQINLSKVVHAASKAIDGGFTVSVIQDTLIAKRNGNRNFVASNTICDFVVAVVLNPVDLEQQYIFKVLIRENTTMLEEREMVYKIAVLPKE